MFLILVYASSFIIGVTISKDIVYPEKNQVQATSISSLSNTIYEAVGMDEFFRKLNEGM